jgi:acyl carrier protein
MAPDQIRHSIRGFFEEAVMYRRARPLSDSESLVKSGLLDSLATLSLIAFLEQTFEIQVADDEVAPGNFGSVDLLTAFVGRKLAGERDEAA